MNDIKHITFDIETEPLPLDELNALMPEFDPSEVKMGNIKDENKMVEKLAEANRKMVESFIANAALHANTGRVAMIGYIVEGKFLWHGLDKCDEATTLRLFWEKADQCIGASTQMVGFKIHEFDLPFMVRRSWKLGIPIPFGVRRGRYWDDCFLDLNQQWLMGERNPVKGTSSLDALAKFFGLPLKTGKGEDFFKMTKKQKLEYSQQDVQITDDIYHKMFNQPKPETQRHD